MSEDIVVEPLLATKPFYKANNGLITLRVHVPQYIWVETLTHRMFARNASSSRAQNSERHISMGFYTPPVFYSDVPGMRVGEPLSPEIQKLANAVYEVAWSDAEHYVKMLTGFGVSREQANRLLPTNKMMTGIVTGTERIWNYFLSLRSTPSADTAMQIFAKKVEETIELMPWDISTIHMPMDDGSHDPMIAAARIARVSYCGKSASDDRDLAERLLRDKHLSPFEHIACYIDPELRFFGQCVFNSQTEDWGDDNRRWVSYRAHVESEKEWLV